MQLGTSVQIAPSSKTKRHRVLHIVSTDQRRGAETFAAQLADKLCGEEFESRLCIIHATEDGPLSCGSVSTYKLRVNSNGRGDGKVATFLRTRALQKAIKDFEPDVVLAHGSSSLLYGALCRIIKRDLVAIYRNVSMASFWVNTPAKKLASRTLIKAFDAVVSLSPKARDDFLRTYRIPSSRLKVIPNGVDVTLFEASAGRQQRGEFRERLGLNDEDVVFISVGSLSPEKNQRLLIALVGELHELGHPVKLLLAGDGPLRGELGEYAATLGVSSIVRFLGTRQDVPDLLGISDIFLLPSHTEVMPAALIEAGISGLPSVAYDVGSVPDVVVADRTGIIVAIEDHAAFRGAVLRLVMSRALRESMGQSARSHCKNIFGMERVAREYGDFILRLLEKGASPYKAE